MEWEYYRVSSTISEDELFRLGRLGWELIVSIQDLGSKLPGRNIESIHYYAINTLIFKRPRK